MTTARPLVHRAALGVLGAAALGLAVASPAAAHVSVSTPEATAGSYATLTFSVPHGCGDSPTTKVEIQIPEEVTAVTPTRQPFYDLSTSTAKLDQPTRDSHGAEVTERTAEIAYTAKTPLPDGQRDAFELVVKLPEDGAGKTVAFPTVQTCEKGNTEWTERPADGQNPDELEHPAPSIHVTDAKDADETADGATAQAQAASANSGSGSGVGSGWTIAALVIGALGLVAGGLALLRGRSRG